MAATDEEVEYWVNHARETLAAWEEKAWWAKWEDRLMYFVIAVPIVLIISLIVAGIVMACLSCGQTTVTISGG